MRGVAQVDAARADGEPTFSARLERGVPPRAAAGAASRHRGVDADRCHPGSVCLRRPARSRTGCARSTVARCRAGAGVELRVDALGWTGRPRLPCVHRIETHLSGAADAAALRRVVHHGLPGLSGADGSTAENGVRCPIHPRLSGSLGGRLGAIGWRWARRRNRLEEPLVAPPRPLARAAGR